jgi:Transcriptional Coactivator p15 (PC4)
LDEKINVHEKGTGEIVYAYVNEYKNKHYLHIREYYLDKEKVEQPSKKGVSLPIEKLDALIEALQKIKSQTEPAQ